MPEEANAGTSPANNNQGGNGSGTDPIKTDAQNPGAFDPSKVGDEDFNKVFDDPRLWKHPRFKGLSDEAKKAKAYEEAEQKRKDEDLKKKGEFETLAQQNEEKARIATEKYQTAVLDNKIQIAASKVGVVDLEAVLKLINRDGIRINDDGSVVGVDEAVSALIAEKAYLKGNGQQPTLGAPTNPGNDQPTGAKRFKLSQLQDPVFYKDNEVEINKALAQNLVEDDMHQR